MPVAATIESGKEYLLTASLSNYANSGITIAIEQEDSASVYQPVTTTTLNSEGIVYISAKATNSNAPDFVTHRDGKTTAPTSPCFSQMRIVFSGTAADFSIFDITYTRVDVLASTVTEQVCSNDEDFEEDYRFGFNGQEKDNEIKGTGNSLDFGARIYDSRLGRWLSLDPLQFRYPNTTPYSFCINNPIKYLDPDGRKWKNFYDDIVDKQIQALISDPDNLEVQQQLENNIYLQNKVNNAIEEIEIYWPELYCYIENLTITPLTDGEANKIPTDVIVRVQLDETRYKGSGGELANVRKFSTDGTEPSLPNASYVHPNSSGVEEYVAMGKNENGEYGFEIKLYSLNNKNSSSLANETGDIIFIMRGIEPNNGTSQINMSKNDYFTSYSAQYSIQVQKMFDYRKANPTDKIPDTKNKNYGGNTKQDRAITVETEDYIKGQCDK